MRRVPWWVAALCATAVVLAAGTLVSFDAPPSYLHPDEQSAALPAQSLAGVREPLPEDLAPYARFFKPYLTFEHGGEGGLSTGLLAVGGVGFGYPLLLAPFYWFGDAAPYLVGALSLALLYLGSLLVLDPRRAVSYPLAALPLAAPPVVMQASLLFSNLPGLAFCVLGVGLLAEAWRGGRGWLVPVGLLAMGAAAAIRLDYLIAFLLMVPLGLLAFLSGARASRRLRLAAQWGAALGLCLVGAVVAFWFVNGTVGIPYLHAPQETETNATGAFERASAAVERIASRADAALFAASARDYLFGFTPVLLALGLLYALRPSRRASGAWLLLPLMAQGLVVWLYTGGTNHYGTGCACVDGSQPRYFMPIYASLALLGALFLRDVLGRLPHAALRAGGAVALAALVVVPGVAHAYQGEHGLDWARGQKEWHQTYEDAFAKTPEDSVVIGNYLSKVVRSRPVLVPDMTPRFVEVVRNLTAEGRPVYGARFWLQPDVDEQGLYGSQLLRSGRAYFVPTGMMDVLEVRTTNATIRQVYDVPDGAWEDAENRTALAARQDPAYFRAVDKRNGSLPLDGLARTSALVTVSWLDDRPGRVVTAGYRNFDSNATVELASWEGTGSGRYVTREFTLPAGRVVTGAFYLTGMPVVKRLEVAWS